jgi:hypothetical protein
MEDIKNLSNLKDFAGSFGEKLRNKLEELISNDEFAGKSALVTNETIFDNQGCRIPFTVQNTAAEFDMFSYTVILTRLQNNEIYASVKYNNQNITDITDFGSCNGNQENNGILDQISNDFKRRFNASKGDFSKLTR